MLEHRLQTLQHDLIQSRVQFETFVRTHQADLDRTEILLSELLQDSQAYLVPANAFVGESPDSVSTDDKEDREPKDREPNKEEELKGSETGCACPHPDCGGSLKLYTRQDNLERHYTKRKSS